MLNKIITNRRLIQGILAVSVYFAIEMYNIPLMYVVILGSILGVIFGKVFCRWMCPIGLLMEVLMGGKKDKTGQQMYSYHKLGCPIAWVNGFFNKYSLIKIKMDPSKCTSCNICDDTCYISKLNPDFSLYKDGKKLAGNSFSCSRCLECVEKCPTGSLTYTL